MQDRIRWAARHLRQVRRPVIIFEFWSTLIFAVSFVPASGWLLDRLVASSGRYAVTDADLFGFVLSPLGILFILLGVGFTLAFWFAEQAALLTIILAALRGTKAPVSRVLWDNFRHMPRLLSLGLRQAAVLLLTAVPFLGGIGLTYVVLLSEFDFYFYYTKQPPAWWTAVAIAGVLGAAYATLAAWLYTRWMLAIPALLFERLSPRAALRRSWTQTRGRVLELALPILVSWGGVIFASLVMTLLIGGVSRWLLADHRTLPVLIPLVVGTLILLALVEMAWFIVGKVMHVMLMTAAWRDTVDPEQLPTDTVPAPGAPLPLGWIRAGSVGACIVLIVTCVGAGAAVIDASSGERAIGITGHRASKRRAPENTLIALERAIAEGADYAEIDVQSTADGVVVLLHDADLMRVARVNRRLNAMTVAELADIDIGTWFDPQFADERVPTLQEFMDVARDRIKLNIEVKFTWPDPHLVNRVGRLIRDNDFGTQCVVSSLNFDALIEVGRDFPELTTGFIVFQAIGDLSRMDADFLSISAAQATPRLVRDAHTRERGIHVWTVNDPDDALSMIEMGVDNIITDEPELIREMLDAWNGLTHGEKLAVMLRRLIVGFEPAESEAL